MDQIKVLVSGKEGQLVSAVINELRSRRRSSDPFEKVFEVFDYDRLDWDITNHHDTNFLFNKIKPDIYINGAAIHVNDQIESDPLKAFEVNVTAPLHILKKCNLHETRFVNFSTNYVFSNTNNLNSSYGSNTIPSPTSLYGITKATLEKLLEVNSNDWVNYRVAGLFGKKGSRGKNGKNFPFLVLDHILENKKMYVDKNQYTSVGYVNDLAKVVVDEFLRKSGDKLVNTNCHLANHGTCSWYEFAKWLAEIFGKEDLIKPKNKINEIQNSVKLSVDSAQVGCLPTWETALTKFIVNDVTKIEKYKELFK